MSNYFFKTIRNTIKYWYLHLIVGILFILVALWVFNTPVATYLTLSILFTVTFLVSGISEIIFALSNRKELDNWGWTLVSGIFSLLIGVLLVANPALSVTTLAFYAGFLVLFRSIWAISISVELKNYGVSQWVMLLIIGILGVLFSFILLWNPLFAGMTLVIWTGLAFLLAGIFAVILAFKLRNMKKFPDRVSKELRERYEQIQEEIRKELND